MWVILGRHLGSWCWIRPPKWPFRVGVYRARIASYGTKCSMHPGGDGNGECSASSAAPLSRGLASLRARSSIRSMLCDLQPPPPQRRPRMQGSGFFRIVAEFFKSGRRAVANASTATAAAASLTASSAVFAQTRSVEPAPPRPAAPSPSDTVRRFGEKFILTPSDSIVVRADTTWFPRRAAPPKAAPPVRSVLPPASPARPSTGGVTRGHGSHFSHSSHSSHSSHRSHRSGGWV